MNDNLIGHGLIDYLFVFAMLAYAFFAGQTKPHRILYILPACLSFFFFIPVGSNLTADKLVPAIFIVSVILSKGSDYFSIANNKANYWVGKLWLLVSLSAIIGTMYSSYYATYVISPQFKTRLITQLIGYINYILIFIIIRKELSKIGGKKIALNAFLITTSILCIYGVYQHFAHQLGLPYRGIVYSVNSTGFGGYQDSKDLIFRVNSLANEPKRLSYFLVISIIILLKYKVEILKKLNFIPYLSLIGIHAIVLWLTYSTSIYVSILILIIFLIIYTLFIQFNKVLFQQLAILLIIGAGTYIYHKAYFDTLYTLRVDKQLEREEVRAEVKGQEFLINNPELFIVGFGPGIYNFALSKEFPGTAGLTGNGTFLIPFNSGLLTYLFDFGIIGFYLLLYPFLQIMLNNKLASKNDFSIFVVFLYCTAITLNPSTTLFFFIGGLEGLKQLEE
jgi:hypothetical protein